MEGARNLKEGTGRCEQSFSTTPGAGGQLIRARADSVVILDTWATANLARFQRLNHHNSISEKAGHPRVSTHPTRARFKFGDGRMGAVRLAVDITAGIAGARGNFAAFDLDAAIPAFSRKGALEALEGRPDFSRGTLTLRFLALPSR